ncbi:diacylglycerol kinase delta-like isoform X2 [Amphiura filiformis]|uniref:diacylglycerol kinase delta-like isoform X2 n=1 Tax=Amphiura filiformis TaxID=82378 RepID=UPI003B214835
MSPKVCIHPLTSTTQPQSDAASAEEEHITIGACIKEGYLTKQTSSFQRWRRRYFKLKGRKLYYAKESTSHIFEEVDLTDISLAENSTKNLNNTFRVITPFRTLILCADSRKEMEDWISALRSASNKDFYEEGEHMQDMLSGMHNWYAFSHARPTYCNVCREALSGVTSHGLSCEVCKYKAHKRCAVRAPNNCKWTTLSSVGKEIIEEEDRTISMPHQWLEGNLPVSAKCSVCDKTCGSVLRLQDWRCLWCKAMVHTNCKTQFPAKCPLGQCRVSLIPPTALNSMDSNGYWQASKSGCTSPLLVFVNSKSGDNQGVKFLRRFKQLLNPAQVFDLMNGGPTIGLRLFQKFDTFRILVCGGDGSIGWVLSEYDKMELHKKCQIGILPLGTGNDLARVLGWGTVCDDDAQLPTILEKLERASTKMLDRWGIYCQETPIVTGPLQTLPTAAEKEALGLTDVEVGEAEEKDKEMITAYEDSVAAHLTKILNSDENVEVISSAKVLCETVKDFVEKVGKAYESSSPSSDAKAMKDKCDTLNEKLNLLLQTLNSEAAATAIPPGVKPSQDTADNDNVQDNVVSEETQHEEKQDLEMTEKEVENKDQEEDRVEQMSGPSTSTRVFQPRDALMSRANSLKKAVRQIIEQTEKAVDEQNAQTEQQEAKALALAVATANGNNGDKPKQRVTIIDPITDVDRDEDTGNKEKEDSEGGVKVRREVPSMLITGQESEEAPVSSPRSTTVFTSSTKAKVERRKTDRDTQKSPRSQMKMRRISHGSTLSSSPGFGPLGLAHRFGSMENISFLPGLDTLLGPALARGPMFGPGPAVSSGLGALGGSIISKVLLANADALCAAASPLMDQDVENVDGYDESCVMNNYFGIGLDAKIVLDFHNKREEHPEKCRSRTKNMMWYGVLGGKELLHRTYRNLEQKVQLECDGQRIPLPSLQGIVVLNIPSYMGGANFWGPTKEDETFTIPSFDDRILEVVAVFGGVQMAVAVSRMVQLQHHRIAQCRVVKITIVGDEGVPVQVDGEAWVQPPGFLKIVHKNRAQMLVRDKQFETTLKSWVDRKKIERQLQPLMEDELAIVKQFAEASIALIESVKTASELSSSIEDEVVHFAVNASNSLEKLWNAEKAADGTSRKVLMEFVSCMKTLHNETSLFLAAKGYQMRVPEEVMNQLNSSLDRVESELRRVLTVDGAAGYSEEDFIQQGDAYGKRTKGKFKFPVVSRFKRPTKKDMRAGYMPTSGLVDVKQWTPEEVGSWLEGLSLGEYRENFIRNDIRGSELIVLERRDLKDIGVTKVGHIKRILQAIKDLERRESERPVSPERSSGPSNSGVSS